MNRTRRHPIARTEPQAVTPAPPQPFLSITNPCASAIRAPCLVQRQHRQSSPAKRRLRQAWAQNWIRASQRPAGTGSRAASESRAPQDLREAPGSRQGSRFRCRRGRRSPPARTECDQERRGTATMEKPSGASRPCLAAGSPAACTRHPRRPSPCSRTAERGPPRASSLTSRHGPRGGTTIGRSLAPGLSSLRIQGDVSDRAFFVVFTSGSAARARGRARESPARSRSRAGSRSSTSRRR